METKQKVYDIERKKVYWIVRDMESDVIGKFHETKEEAQEEFDRHQNDGDYATMFRCVQIL